MELAPALEPEPRAAEALERFDVGPSAAVISVLADATLEEPIASICLSPGHR